MDLNELKRFHAKGLAIILLHPKSKRPIESKWTSGPRKEWEELELALKEGKYNIGVRLGEPSKLTNGRYLGAIDCDVKSKSRKALREMNEKLRELGIDLGEAPIVTSGRGNGSKHVYVQTEKPLKPGRFAKSERQVKVLMPGEKREFSKAERKTLTDDERNQGYRLRAAWEISLMGTGQQTVLPPSVHPDTGFKYAWASPLQVKRLPVFKPRAVVRDVSPESDQDTTDQSEFKPEKVDLYETRLPLYLIRAIESGEGCEDRSATLFSAAMAMCRVGLTDNQILSVLSDPEHWLAEAGYEHTGSRSRTRAVGWLRKYTLTKARYETHPMRRFENRPNSPKPSKEEAAKLVAKIDEERAELLPDRDGNNKPKPTVRNVVHVLEKHFGGGLVGLNQFSNRVYFLKDTPYGGKKGRELTDHDDLELSHYLACHYRFEPGQDVCLRAHALVARRNAWHPVREYLEGLTWDKRPRLDEWLRKAFSASGPKGYLGEVGKKVLVAAVKRVFEPGCKFDYVMVLEGPQGKGKSMALGGLAGQTWFTDSLGDIHQKDVVDQMVGKWIIELAELASIRKAESEYLKSFLSRQVDRVRPPYGRRSEDFPRQSIFIGSTNSSEYLSDETGNRRIWPVKINSVDRAWLKENRDQLWAEALVRYEIGEDTYLDEESEEIARKEQEKRFDVDEWEPLIRKMVTEQKREEYFITTEIWRALHLNDSGGHPNMIDQKRIGKIMTRLGFRRSAKKVDETLTRCWVRG